jgi:tetratricopeptide (TPR) repeat protein
MDEKQTIADCARMSDEELVRVLTLDKDDYTEFSLQLVAREMARRKLELAEFINRVRIGLNDGEPENCTIDQALARLKQEIALWDNWHFTNCLREKISIQKEVAFWTVHFFEDEVYQQSFVIKTFQDIEVFVTPLLRLAAGNYPVAFQYYLDECEIFAESYSSGYIEKTSNALAKADVPHTVRTSEPPSSRQILIPKEYVEVARAVASEVAAKIKSLRNEISVLAEKDEHDPRLLELYDQLAQLVEDDHAVCYGRGVLLFERGRNEEAAEAFIELAHTCIGSRHDLPTADFEAYWQAAESHLERLSAALPENLGVLHCLARMAMFDKNDDKAKAYYDKILAIAPTDGIAHHNLGYMYYDDPHYHARAARHFRSYLDSQPDAEDRAAIEEILANL